MNLNGIWRKISIGTFLLTLFLMVSTQLTVASHAQSIGEKGIVFGSDVVLKGLPSPSFADLRQAGFTLVGTNTKSWYGSWEWDRVRAWLKSADDAGFRTFVNFWAEPNEAARTVKRLISMGVDVIVWDEPISRYNVGESQMQSVINTAIMTPRHKSELLFIINEWDKDNVAKAYEWTAEYKSVVIATDDYGDKTVIDLGIKLAQQYGKTPFAWLIFSIDEREFPCYKALDEWIAYAKQRNLGGVLFWVVDSTGTWQTQWQKVAAF